MALDEYKPKDELPRIPLNLDNSDGNRNDNADNATQFLSKFEGDQKQILEGFIQEINNNPQLKTGFEELLKPENADNFISTIKDELEFGIKEGYDKETLIFTIKSVIAESIDKFRINQGINQESNEVVQGAEATDKDEENADKDEENADKDEENAAQKGVETTQIEENAAQKGVETTQIEKTAVKKKEELEEKVKVAKIIKSSRIAFATRVELLHKYDGLQQKTDKGSDLYNEVENKLKNSGVLNQLEEIGKSINDSNFVEKYISFQATLQELKSNPTIYEPSDISGFEKIVKELNNSCNIPDTNLSSFSSENLTRTRTELFNSEVGNDSLIKAKNQNMESHNYSEIFPEMGDDELIVTYGKFLEGDSKKFWLQYQNDPEMKNKINSIQTNSNPTDEENQLLQNYTTMVENLRKIKDERENNAKDFMEEMCLISQIKGISMCIGQEGGKDFNLNKANEIQNDNGVLTLQGHIDGADLSVRQDTNDPEAHLQTYSKLAIAGGDKNTFKIGGDDNYVDSPFILPSQKEIFTEITGVVKSDFDNLKTTDNLSNYFETLQSKIMGRMDNVYEDASLAHHYITNKVKGEKIVDKSKGLIEKIKPDIDFSKSINQANNPDLYPFLKILKFNIDNSTTEEKNKLEKCIGKIGEISNSYRENQGQEKFDSVKYPQIVDNYFKNETWLKDGNENSKIKLISDFFGYYSQNSIDMRANIEGSEGMPSKMVINDIYRDLFESNNGNNKSQTAVKREREQKLNSYRKEEEDQSKKADQGLRLDDDNIWKR